MDIEITGNLKGQTLFFLAAFPDTSDVYRENLMKSFAKQFRIVSLTLPGFGEHSPFHKSFEAYQRAKAAERARQQVDSDGGHTGAVPGWLKSILSRQRAQRPVDAAEKTGECVFSSSASNRDAAEGQQRRGRETPFHTSFAGHRFDDTVSLLGIALDTAMETHNYCPEVFLASSVVGSGATTVEGVPAHQLPPFYPKPIIITHGWVSMLLTDFSLARPTFFSRVVFLQHGVSVYHFEDPIVRNSREVYSPSFSVHAASLRAARREGGETSVPTATSTHGASPVKAAGRRHRGAHGEVVEPRTRQDLLAAQYAFRSKPKGLHRRFRWFSLQYIKGQLGLFLVALFYICVFPRQLASLLLQCFYGLFTRRPTYYYDSHIRMTPSIERLNRRLFENYCDHVPLFASDEDLSSGKWTIRLVPFVEPQYNSHSHFSIDGGYVKLAGKDTMFVYNDETHENRGRGHGRRVGEPQGLSASASRTSSVLQKPAESPLLHYDHAEIASIPCDGSFLFFQDGAKSACQRNGSSSILRSSNEDMDIAVRAKGVYYQSFFFPRDSSELLGGGSSCSSSSTTSTNPALSHASGGKQKKTKPLPRVRVHVHIKMCWLHLRYFLTCILFCFLGSSYTAGRHTSAEEEEVLHEVAHLVSTTDPHDVAELKTSLAKMAACSQPKASSPFMSFRFFVPINVPVLFLYGTKGKVRFSDQWVDYVKDKRATDGISDVIPVRGGGDWFFAEKQCQHEVEQYIADFLTAESL